MIFNVFGLSLCMFFIFCGKVFSEPYGVTANYDDGTLSIISLNSNKVINTVNINEANPHVLAYNPIESKIYVGGGRAVNYYIDYYDYHYVATVDAKTMSVTDKIKIGHSIAGMAANPSNSRLYVASGSSNYVSVVDMSTNKIINKIQLPASVKFQDEEYNIVKTLRNMAINQDGTMLFLILKNNSIAVIDTKSNSVIDNLVVPLDDFIVSLYPKLHTLLISGSKGVWIQQKDGAFFKLIDSPWVDYPVGDLLINSEINKLYISIGWLGYCFGGYCDNDGIAVNENGITKIYASRNKTGKLIMDESSGMIYGLNYDNDRVTVIDSSKGYSVISSIPVGTRAVDLIKIELTTSLNQCFFDWAQNNYQTIFYPKTSEILSAGDYSYRYFYGSNFYLAVSSKDQHVYYMSGSDGIIHDAGLFSEWQKTSFCN